MSVYRSVDEVVTALNDRAKAEAVMSRVNKGSKGSFSYVPWNETVRLLDEVFGPFGWSAKITDRQVTHDGSNYIYSVGLDLTVFVRDESGGYISVSRPGVGVGIASPNKEGFIHADAHDTAAKGARSDALSVAAKSLGNAFGLFLYDRGDPARNDMASPVQQRKDFDKPVPNNGAAKAGKGPRPTEGQLKFGRSLGWSDEDFAGMDFKDWKAILDEKRRKAGNAVPAAKAAPKVVPTKPKAEEPGDLSEFLGELEF